MDRMGSMGIAEKKFSDMRESELQADCNEFLRTLGIPFVHIEKGKGKNKTHRKGIPDLIITLKNSKVWFVELKTEKGDLDPEQIKFKNAVEQRGHEFTVIRPSTFSAFCTLSQR